MVESSGLLSPLPDVAPVPRGTAPDGPLRLWEDAAPLPLVDGSSSDSEAVSDLGEADDGGVRFHAVTVEKVLTPGKVCVDNLYMTKRYEVLSTGSKVHYAKDTATLTLYGPFTTKRAAQAAVDSKNGAAR